MTEAGMRAVAVVAALVALGPLWLAAPAGAAARDQAARYLQSLAAAAPPRAAHKLDPEAEKLAKALAGRFGVQVLRVRKEESGGKPVYRVVVMRRGGNFNDAYAVETLTVDPATGDLVPQFRNEVSGYRLSAPADHTPRDDAVATTIRRESFHRAE